MRESPRLASSQRGPSSSSTSSATTAVVPPRQRPPSLPRWVSPYSIEPALAPPQGLGHDLGAAARVVAGVGEPAELLDHDPARDVAAVVAAHPVGDHEDRRVGEEGVLVDLAHQADVGRRRRSAARSHPGRFIGRGPGPRRCWDRPLAWGRWAPRPPRARHEQGAPLARRPAPGLAGRAADRVAPGYVPTSRPLLPPTAASSPRGPRRGRR